LLVGLSAPKALERHAQAISQCTEPLHHSLQSVSSHAFFSVSPKLLPGSCIHFLTIASDKGPLVFIDGHNYILNDNDVISVTSRGERANDFINLRPLVYSMRP